MIYSPYLRFAPSPNGRLHVGHAYSAWLNTRMAEAMGGTFLLRLEDIDITRCTDGFVNACLDDLRWLGLRWNEPVHRQSEHGAAYRDALDHLRIRGLVYPCFCTRREVAANSHTRDPDGAPIYAGTCRSLSTETTATFFASGKPCVWRLNMSAALHASPGPYRYRAFSWPEQDDIEVAAQPSCWGDVVLARKDVPTSYHLSVVVDDALQHISHVVRGRDLQAATDIHVLLQALLTLPHPRYHHHGLILNAKGDKLSKSKGSETLSALRSGNNVTPAQLTDWFEWILTQGGDVCIDTLKHM